MTHKWMSHGTHVIESWYTCECAMAHMWMSHGTQVNESWHTCEWVMAHTWMSHGTHVKKSWHTCKCAIAHMWISNSTHVNEPRHTCEYIMWYGGLGNVQISTIVMSQLISLLQHSATVQGPESYFCQQNEPIGWDSQKEA